MNTLNSVQAIPVIIDRHTEDAAFLWLQRDAAVYEPHYDLKDLAELDDRLEAHLDGLLVAGDAGWKAACSALSFGEPGEVFVAAWLAVAALDGEKLSCVMDVAKTSRENYRALVSALAWHPAEHTSGLLQSFLNANDPSYLALGINACALHRIDPGKALQAALSLEDEQHVARALRSIGELGRKDLLAELNSFQSSASAVYSFWSNWSSVLLGNRLAIDLLKQQTINNTEFATRAMPLVARVLPSDELKNLLQHLVQDKKTVRLAMMGAGISGDPFWVPGLLKYMEDPEVSRVAGEAFCMITGIDLAYQDLDVNKPEGFSSGPTEDPADENVTLDEDMDLPWPNRTLLLQWWQDNNTDFRPGVRYLCGKPLSKQQCQVVIRQGFQRQRTAAAMELALLGLPFIETRAPGRRQVKLL